MDNIYIRIAKIFWQLLLLPWRFMFAFVPPCHIAHGWISFICSLLFISGIAYIVTKITDLISCVTGSNSCSMIFQSTFFFTFHYASTVALLITSFILLYLFNRNKCLRHSIYSTSQWNFMAWFSGEQDCCWTSKNSRLCNCKHHLQVFISICILFLFLDMVSCHHYIMILLKSFLEGY
jgi:hypothetical protein